MHYILYRPATPADAAACIAIRSQTRENAFTAKELQHHGITPETLGAQIADSTICGYLCVDDTKIVGYCFGAYATAEIIVLALLPDYENKGLGKTLLDMVLDELRRTGALHASLGCTTDPTARAYGFYRHLGWTSTGQYDEMGDEILTLEL
jgi:ribosomal protein S18 acetylase RimI-like enzyme